MLEFMIKMISEMILFNSSRQWFDTEITEEDIKLMQTMINDIENTHGYRKSLLNKNDFRMSNPNKRIEKISEEKIIKKLEFNIQQLNKKLEVHETTVENQKKIIKEKDEQIRNLKSQNRDLTNDKHYLERKRTENLNEISNSNRKLRRLELEYNQYRENDIPLDKNGMWK